jgi:hypothetical protein
MMKAVAENFSQCPPGFINFSNSLRRLVVCFVAIGILGGRYDVS